MAVIDQEVKEEYAVYNGDSAEVLPTIPEASIHLSVYSPPFAELYNYSSSERDLSNCRDYEEFLDHYEFIVKEMARITMAGRSNCIHCMDLSRPGGKGLLDFPGDIVRLHEKHGFQYQARYVIWKEPLRMAIKTRAIGLRHSQVVSDSARIDNAGADYLLLFRKKGKNPEPIQHPEGFFVYEGETIPEERIKNGYAPIPTELSKYRKGWKDAKTNKWSHWIWQHYASSVWYDIRIRNCLDTRGAKEDEEEKHICPLQLDVINRCMVMWSNPGDKVLTPFMGVGSEVVGALKYGRRGIGIELKPSYYQQARKNIRRAIRDRKKKKRELL